MGSNSDWVKDIADRWLSEARALERSADSTEQPFTAAERKMLRFHARVLSGRASELRIEAMKVRRG